MLVVSSRTWASFTAILGGGEFGWVSGDRSVTSRRSSARAAPSLYGRQNARHEFLEGLKRVLTVFLVGEGGTGRTRLLIEVEAALRDLHPECHGISQPKGGVTWS